MASTTTTIISILGTAPPTQPSTYWMWNCTIAKNVSSSTDYFLINNFQLAVAVLALLFLPLFRRPWRHKLSCPRNLQLIIQCAFVFHVLHLFSVFVTRLHYEVMYFVEWPDPCDYMSSVPKCLLFRLPYFVSIIGFTLVHVAVCVERSVATFQLTRYEEFGESLGRWLVAAVYTLTALWTLFIFRDADFSVQRAYVAADTPENGLRLLVMFLATVAMDAVATVFNFALMFINRRQIRIGASDYRLSRSFQLRENGVFLRIFLPVTVVHSAIFAGFLALNLLNRVLRRRGEAGRNNVEGLIRYETIQTLLCVDAFLTPALYLYLRIRVAREKALRSDASISAFRADDAYWRRFRAHVGTLDHFVVVGDENNKPGKKAQQHQIWRQ